ncbi:hypothetical protein JTE90_019083 [Oedothorax gibbosus]|uniref:Uncharacterized protein n=1 Tax=Oedothorax gibbosus TaxID=931172 RepID=A0AAV6TG46_9ARAC|nr:hypothetical protein JTE90_019083 [Oedothorax gibbosus]
MPAFMDPVWKPLPHERPLYGKGLSSLDNYSDAFSYLPGENEEGKTASLVEGLLANLAALPSLSDESDAISQISSNGNE